MSKIYTYQYQLWVKTPVSDNLILVTQLNCVRDQPNIHFEESNFTLTKRQLLHAANSFIFHSFWKQKIIKSWQKITDITTTVIGGPTKTKTTDYKDKISNQKYPSSKNIYSKSCTCMHILSTKYIK